MMKFGAFRNWLMEAMNSRFGCPMSAVTFKEETTATRTPAQPSLPRTEAEIARVASSVGLAIPEACMPGVVANLALLDGHAAILSGRAPGVAS